MFNYALGMVSAIVDLFVKKETTKATVISMGTTITGQLETIDLLFVAGNIYSDKITCPQLVLEKTGDIRSDILTDTLHVYGVILGNIQANEVYIHEGARVYGDISYAEILSIDTSRDTMVNGTIKNIMIKPEDEKLSEQSLELIQDARDLIPVDFYISPTLVTNKKQMEGRTKRPKRNAPTTEDEYVPLKATQALKDLMALEPVISRAPKISIMEKDITVVTTEMAKERKARDFKRVCDTSNVPGSSE
jgi:cytoskeletal protein CcmA (bactofilin family)